MKEAGYVVDIPKLENWYVARAASKPVPILLTIKYTGVKKIKKMNQLRFQESGGDVGAMRSALTPFFRWP